MREAIGWWVRREEMRKTGKRTVVRGMLGPEWAGWHEDRWVGVWKNAGVRAPRQQKNDDDGKFEVDCARFALNPPASEEQLVESLEETRVVVSLAETRVVVSLVETRVCTRARMFIFYSWKRKAAWVAHFW